MTRQPHHDHLDAMQASVDTARLDAGEMTLAEWATRGERRLLVAAGEVREDRPRDATAELLRAIREEVWR